MYCQFTQSRLRIARVIGLPMRLPTPNTRQDLHAILFDDHAAPSSIAELPAREVAVDVRCGERKAGWYTVESP